MTLEQVAVAVRVSGRAHAWGRSRVSAAAMFGAVPEGAGVPIGPWGRLGRGCVAAGPDGGLVRLARPSNAVVGR
jgi:hypothetical protein